MTRELVEMYVRDGVQWLRLAVECIGATMVALGIIIAGSKFLYAIFVRRSANFTAIRLVLARYLALALEFQLGADILSTAIAPTWTEIGKLGAIAVIRTALNYFLSREMQQERVKAAAEGTVVKRSAGEEI